MKRTIIILAISLMLCFHVSNAIGRQWAEENKKQAAADANKPKLVKVLQPWTEERLKLMDRHPPSITAMALSPNGKLLAWGDYENNVFLWFSQEDKLVVVKDTTVTKPSSEPYFSLPVETIRFIQDDVFYWMHFNNKLWRADIKQGKVSVKRSVSFTDRGSWSEVIKPDSVIINTHEDYNMSMWKRLFRMTSIGSAIFDTAISIIFMPDTVHELRKYDLVTGKYKATCKLYQCGILPSNIMVLSPDDSMLALVSDFNAGLVSLKNFKLVQSFDPQAGRYVAISPGNSRIAIGSSTKTKIYNTETGKLIYTFPKDISRIGSTATSFAFENEDILWFFVGWEMYRLNIKSGEIRLVWDWSSKINPRKIILDRENRRLYLGDYSDGAVRICELP